MYEGYAAEPAESVMVGTPEEGSFMVYYLEGDRVAAAAAERLSRALGLEPVIARLLVQRGLSDPDEAARFLKPSLDHLHDPCRLTGLDAAVARLEAAFAARELDGPLCAENPAGTHFLWHLFAALLAYILIRAAILYAPPRPLRAN